MLGHMDVNEFFGTSDMRQKGKWYGICMLSSTLCFSWILDYAVLGMAHGLGNNHTLHWVKSFMKLYYALSHSNSLCLFGRMGTTAEEF